MENKQSTQTAINMASKAYNTFPACQCKGNASNGVSESSKFYTAMLWLHRKAMNKSHMLYQSGSQSEESGQTVLGFVAIAIGAGAVAYVVYKIAEPLTTMLQNIP
jgi:hypothetical protein